MCSIGCYTATDQPVAALQAAGERVDGIDLLVRSGSDLQDPAAAERFGDRLLDRDVVVAWLHGAESRMPDFPALRDRLRASGVPVVVVGPEWTDGEGDPAVDAGTADRVREYVERGGLLNFENLFRFLADRYGAGSWPHDDPVELPTTGVYHPDHPGATRADLEAILEPDRPTVGLWFYASHWTFENARYVDALVEAFETQGVDAVPVFTTPVAEEAGERDARWVAREWFGPMDVDAVVSTFMYSLSMDERGRSAAEARSPTGGVLEELNVPVLQAMVSMRPRAAYHADDAGLPPFELSLSVALPELDGVVVTHPISGKERVDPGNGASGTLPVLHRPIAKRVDHVARLASQWARLGRRPVADRRLAIVLHNYPPSADGIGTAFGLDTTASLDRLLDRLADRGYRIEDRPPRARALFEELVGQLDLDGRWIDTAEGVATIKPERYRQWFESLDPSFREDLTEEWGQPPATPISVPGVQLGNVLVTVQPPRGFEADPAKVYHDSALQPPHEYVAAYEWIREGFDADAVVHLGTHGSLEWLPGKTVGLDSASAPDALLEDLPNVYPYVLNNPGEGAQATRRSYATIVDHLPPPMRAAGIYDDLAGLEKQVREYRDRLRDGADPAALEGLATAIREAVEEQDLGPDLGIEDVETVDIARLARELHAYLTDVRDTQIRMGLHVLGEPPAEGLLEYIVALTRQPNPGAPSLRVSVAGAMGVPADRMLDAPEEFGPGLEMTYAEAADRVREESLGLLEALAERDFAARSEEIAAVIEELPVLGTERDADAVEDLRAVLEYVQADLYPRLEATTAELSNTIAALEGAYVPPGGSGAPTRGNADVLPTGRNFYTLDPRRVPTKAAWAVGESIAEGVLDRHREEQGEYPEEIGVVAWGTPTVRTRGETVAQILALLGVEPVYTEAGRVEGIEPIPLDELGRPRVDVTTRVSGLFRDAFPAVAGLLQEAVETVAGLEEPPERNYVRKHALEDGAFRDDESAGLRRVFTTRPGGYGSGTNKAITTGNWEDEGDLADVFVTWGGYALGTDGEVEPAEGALERELGRIEATVKLEDTAEQDEFDSADWYAFHGGLKQAVADRRGEAPASYVGDASDPDRPTIYTNEEKLRHTMRTRVLNPDWIESMEDHDYKGAGDLASTVDIALGWAATSEAISDTLWESLADAYAFEEDRQEWFMEANPWALESITDTFLEAIDRGLWEADPSTVDALRDLNLRVDGHLEGADAPEVGQ